jgi:hypothetical protein
MTEMTTARAVLRRGCAQRIGDYLVQAASNTVSSAVEARISRALGAMSGCLYREAATHTYIALAASIAAEEIAVTYLLIEAYAELKALVALTTAERGW